MYHGEIVTDILSSCNYFKERYSQVKDEVDMFVPFHPAISLVQEQLSQDPDLQEDTLNRK